MSALTRRRRRYVVAALLVFYLFWPLIQHQLVRVYRVDPWKLAGWAMYTTPSARVRIHLTGVDTMGRNVQIDPTSSAELKHAVVEFARLRRRLGLFVEPESIAESLLEQLPEYQEWTVVVEQVGLTAENFFGVIHRRGYRYRNTEGRIESVEVRPRAEPNRGDERLAAASAVQKYQSTRR